MKMPFTKRAKPYLVSAGLLALAVAIYGAYAYASAPKAQHCCATEFDATPFERPPAK